MRHQIGTCKYTCSIPWLYTSIQANLQPGNDCHTHYLIFPVVPLALPQIAEVDWVSSLQREIWNKNNLASNTLGQDSYLKVHWNGFDSLWIASNFHPTSNKTSHTHFNISFVPKKEFDRLLFNIWLHVAFVQHYCFCWTSVAQMLKLFNLALKYIKIIVYFIFYWLKNVDDKHYIKTPANVREKHNSLTERKVKQFTGVPFHPSWHISIFHQTLNIHGNLFWVGTH